LRIGAIVIVIVIVIGFVDIVDADTFLRPYSSPTRPSPRSSV